MGVIDVIFKRKCQYDIQCIEFGVDNASVNVRAHKSIMKHVKPIMTPVYFMVVLLCIILHARVPILIDLIKVQSRNVFYKS